MTGTIMCAVDGSPHSAPAIELAARMAAAMKQELTIAAVNQISRASGFPPIKAWSEPELKAIMDAAASTAQRHGVRKVKRVAIEAHDIAEALASCAVEQGIDHIVMGTGDASLAGRLLLGSVSDAVVRDAPCTVTIARERKS